MTDRPRTEVRRKPERGAYDTDTINAILDEALICHVGFIAENGYPVVLPTIHARSGATIYLHGSLDQDDGHWIVSLRDVSPNGRQVELSKGFLKASHRAVDEARSKRYEPRHPHVDPEPVEPGRVYEFAIALAPLSNLFKAGHRIRLVISSMDHARARNLELAPESLGRTHAPWHLGSSKTTLHKIFHDPEHPSHLLLPIIPAS